MKLVCSQSELNTNLSLVSRAVPSRPTHPVLGNVLLTADASKQRVSLTGFDLSLGIETSFAAQVIEEGTLTLPAKLLNDLVSRLPEGELTLFHEAEDGEQESKITLTSASGRFQLMSMSAEEYPALPTIDTSEAIHLPAELLGEGLHGALFAASTEETKQVLTGVHLKFQEDSLEFAATDGHRLAVVETSNSSEEEGSTVEDFAVTIPARALREVERMLGMQEKTELIALKVDEAQVVFEFGQQRLTSRKLEGAYPAYHQLIPNQFQRQMTLERRRLISALELVAVMADQKNHLVKFTLDSEQQQLSLSVNTKETGSAYQSLPAQISGDSLEIAFNLKYLMDGLKALGTSEIQMQLNGNMQPVIFTPLGETKMTYLVMPVQLKGA